MNESSIGSIDATEDGAVLFQARRYEKAGAVQYGNVGILDVEIVDDVTGESKYKTTVNNGSFQIPDSVAKSQGTYRVYFSSEGISGETTFTVKS